MAFLSVVNSAGFRLILARRRASVATMKGRRRALLIGAAEHVFLKYGYHAATMDQVAARVKMSKRTLYKLFATKEALFRAMVADRSQTLTEDVAETGRPPEEALVALLQKAADFVLAPRQVALCRLVIAERARSPRLARSFLQSVPQHGLGPIERWLTNLAGRGVISLSDPALSARMLFGLTIGFAHTGLLLGLTPAPTKPAVDAQIQLGVQIFLDGCGRKTRP
jgi:TetR/AcrR family transcriptional regulator of autoinduction and epiphytic fitness